MSEVTNDQSKVNAAPVYLDIDKSVYIPKVHFSVDENFMYNKLIQFGQIYRIDFIPVYKKYGFQEDLTSNIKSAFVHFSNIREDFEYRIRTEGRITFYTDIGAEYWIILESKNRIQPTMMNNAQIVDNCRYLENIITEQEKKIQELENKLDALRNVVRQLIGGMFNQVTQNGIIQEHLYNLFSEDTNQAPNFTYNSQNKWLSWPTTRQGDENERRIEALEKVISDMYRNDTSTHSSMPELISPDYVNVIDPEIYDVSSTSSNDSYSNLEQKLTNSYYLYGNN